MSTLFPPVLVAEDEESDALILRRVFAMAKVPNPLIIVRDGQEAVDYLSGTAPYDNRSIHPLPGLLLLDLKMPRMTGFDVLGWLAIRPEYAGLPAVVLSSSSLDSDQVLARRLGAREYFIKPQDLSEFVKLVQRIQAHWLFPSKGTPP